jgi:hypothetical protein
MGKAIKVSFLVGIILCLFVFVPGLQAQDTVYVEPGVGTLNDAVAANVGGPPVVYKLLRGEGALSVFTLTEQVGVDTPLVIIGEIGSKNDPPVIMIRSAEAGTGANASLIRTTRSLKVENVAIIGKTLQGDEMKWVVFLESADGATYEFYNCYFDHTANAMIRCLAANPTVILEDCLILNAASNGSYQGGFVVRYRQIIPKLTRVTNCTVINMGSTFITNIKSYLDTNMELDHNTFILANRDFITPNDNWIDWEMKNNIFVDMFARGYAYIRIDSEGDTTYFGDYVDDPDYSGWPDPDSLAGFLHWDTLAPEYHDEYPEAEREAYFHHNTWVRTPTMLDWYDEMHFTEMPFMHIRAQGISDDDATWPGIQIDEPGEGTCLNVLPQFTKAVPDSFWTNYQTWVEYWRNLKIQETNPVPNKLWDFDDQPLGPIIWGDDLKEVLDLSYPDTDPCYRAAEMGYPLGDLNWFPELKAKWEQGIDISAIEAENGIAPTEFRVYQNYPNPFNPTTTISYILSRNDHVKLSIYNVLGQKVKTLVDQKQKSGAHEVVWNGTNDVGQKVVSGVYFYRISTENHNVTKKMALLK